MTALLAVGVAAVLIGYFAFVFLVLLPWLFGPEQDERDGPDDQDSGLHLPRFIDILGSEPPSTRSPQ